MAPASLVEEPAGALSLQRVCDSALDVLSAFFEKLKERYDGPDPERLFAQHADLTKVEVFCKRALVLGIEEDEIRLMARLSLRNRAPTRSSMATYRCLVRRAGYPVPRKKATK